MRPLIETVAPWLPLLAVILWLSRAGRDYVADRRDAGPVVLDVGGFPFARLLGGMFCVALFALAWRWIHDPVVWLGVFFLILVLMVATSARVQIREAGVWHGFGLIPWIAVTRYRWTRDGRLRLEFHEEAAHPPIVAFVPANVRSRIESLLQENVSQDEEDDETRAVGRTGRIRY